MGNLTYGSFVSSDVTQSGLRNLYEVVYLNAGEGIKIHMLIRLNHYCDIIQPDSNRLSCGFVAQNSKLGYIISGICLNNKDDSNISNVTPLVLCCISSSPTARNDDPNKDVHNFWSLESIGIDAPVSSMTVSMKNDLPSFFTESVQSVRK